MVDLSRPCDACGKMIGGASKYCPKANFEIKHDANGKETMAITCKDETSKEIKIGMPWEKVKQLRK